MSSARPDHSTVVCVDDDEMVVDLMAAILPRTGAFDVEGFTDAERALARIASGGVDCVVSDYEMPRLDGFDLLERVRTTDPDLPFILYTANGGEDFASDAVDRGATEFVRKETGSEQFALLGRRIEEAVARYRDDDRFRSVSATREAVCIVREDGTFEYANRAYLDLFGYRSDELLDAEWQLLQPALAVERLLTEVLPTVRERGEWSGEGIGRRADGTTFREGTSISRFPDGGLMVVVVDLDGPTEAGGVGGDVTGNGNRGNGE